MKALLAIDFQNGFLKMGDFRQEKKNVQRIIKDFKCNNQPVVFMQHRDENTESPIAFGSEGSELDPHLKIDADYVIEKCTPSAFFNTNLDELLRSLGVNHIFITGFNTEYCPQFTAIAAYDRGYKVTFIEDATATVNDDIVYEFPGLDIRNFVGSVLNWSNVIEVLYFEEYIEKYAGKGLKL